MDSFILFALSIFAYEFLETEFAIIRITVFVFVNVSRFGIVPTHRTIVILLSVKHRVESAGMDPIPKLVVIVAGKRTVTFETSIFGVVEKIRVEQVLFLNRGNRRNWGFGA